MPEQSEVEQGMGVPASPSGSRASHGAADASPKASIPNADDWLGNLDEKPNWKIAQLMRATADMIDLYSKNVANAEERYRQERAMLAAMMDIYARLAHYTLRKGALALEQDAASAAISGEQSR